MSINGCAKAASKAGLFSCPESGWRRHRTCDRLSLVILRPVSILRGSPNRGRIYIAERSHYSARMTPVEERIEILCKDDTRIAGHLWTAGGRQEGGSVIINPATGVVARYYHRYARFLASHGFDVITYDYRGIGLSRPQRLQDCGYRWRDWGELDFDAVLRFTRARRPERPASEAARRYSSRRHSAGSRWSRTSPATTIRSPIAPRRESNASSRTSIDRPPRQQ